MPGPAELGLFVDRLEAIGSPYMVTDATPAKAHDAAKFVSSYGRQGIGDELIKAASTGYRLEGHFPVNFG